MLRIGLTGGIGSGKSTVARIFRVLGAPVFEADAEGRRLLSTDPGLHERVIGRFGPGIYPKGELDRKALADVVFSDPVALADLNAMVHPAVRGAFHTWAAEQQAPYVVMEAAILVDTGGHAAFDRLVVVSAPEDLRIERVMQRDGVGREEVRARLSNQVPEADRLAAADHVIVNDERSLLIPQVLRVHAELMDLAGN